MAKEQVGPPSVFYYLLATVGSAAYFLGQSEGFWAGVVSILKALVWPVFLTYDLFAFLN